MGKETISKTNVYNVGDIVIYNGVIARLANRMAEIVKPEYGNYVTIKIDEIVFRARLENLQKAYTQ